MKRLNVKLILILAVCFIVFTGSVVVVHGIQMTRSADSLMQRADSIEDSSDVDAMREKRLLYERYMRYKPDDLQRQVEFALLSAKILDLPEESAHDRNSDFRIAFAALTNVVKDLKEAGDTSHPELRMKLVDLLLLTRNRVEAKQHLVEMQTLYPDDPQVDFKLAYCHALSGDFLDAVKLLQKSIGYNPETKAFDAEKAIGKNTIESYELLARLLRENIEDAQLPERAVIANAVMDRLTAVNPESGKAHLTRARYLHQYGSPTEAKLEVEHALKLDADDPMALRLAIEIALREQNFEQAQALIARGIEKHPKTPLFLVLWVEIPQSQNNLDEARKRLTEALKKLPDAPELLVKQFDFQLRDHHHEAAAVTVKRMREAKVNPVLCEYYDAKILIAKGQLLEGSQRIEKLRNQLSAFGGSIPLDADHTLMRAYQTLGQSDLALAASRRVITSSPSDVTARIIEATALSALGKSQEAEDKFKVLANVLESTNQLEKAPGMLMPVLNLRINEQLALPKDRQDWTKVDEMVKLLEEKGIVKQPQLSLLQARLMQQRGMTAEANELMQKTLQQFPDDANVVATSAREKLASGNAEEAVRILESAPASIRNSPTILAERIGAVLARNGKADELKAGLEAIVKDVEKLPKDNQAGLYQIIASAFTGIGNVAEAKKYWQLTADLKPEDVRVRWLMFAIARDQNDEEAMGNLIDWFAKRFGQNSVQVKLAKASRIVTQVRASMQKSREEGGDNAGTLTEKDQKSLREARNLLLQVKSARPDWYEWPRITAEVDLLENKIDDCITNLQATLEMGPRDMRVIKQLVQLLRIRQRNEEAKVVLDKYGSLGADMWRQEVAVRLDSNEPIKALEVAERVLPKDSTNAGDHLFHGQVLLAAGKKDEAEAAFRRAAELAPESPDTWLTLITYLASNNKLEHAKKVVEEAQIKLPEDIRATTLARGYAAVGELERAEQFYQAALKAAPNDSTVARMAAEFYINTNRLDQGKKLIDGILAQTEAAPAKEPDLAWAKRASAKIKAMTGDYQSFLAGVKMLTPENGRLSLDDLMALIDLYSNRPEPVYVRQAVQMLQSLTQIRPLTANERIQLANLNERLGNWREAREHMLAALGEENPGAGAYITYIQMLLRRGLTTEVAPWLDRLKRIAPDDSIDVKILQARYDARRGQKDQAAASLLSLLPDERPLPKDQWARMNHVASLLQSIELYDQAEKLLRENLGDEPAQWLPLAGFLASRGKIDESLDLIEQHRRSARAAGYLPVAFEAARQRIVPATPEQMARIEKIFESALREDPESSSIELLLANLREIQGRYDEVEAIYRKVLARPETPPNERAVASNNLAYILVLTGKNIDEAQKLIDESIERLGPRTDLLDTRGLIALAKGDTTKAVADLTDAVAEVEPSATKYLHLAEACAEAKDLTAAQEALENARERKFKAEELPPLEKVRYDKLLEALGLDTQPEKT